MKLAKLTTKAIKYGVPTGFLYCTIYEMNVWNQSGDELVKDQKRVWREFFERLRNHGHRLPIENNKIGTKLMTGNYSTGIEFNSLKECWNNKVITIFKEVDKIVQNPVILVCRTMRWWQSKTQTQDKN